MKKDKSKQAGMAESGSGNGNTRDFRGKRFVLKSKHYSEDPEDWPRPTELELARLAAALARTEEIDPKQLVREAWGIFVESCQRIQEDRREVERRREQEEGAMDAWERRDDGLPRPRSYPVTFQEMERLLLPKLRGRTAERAALFREYIFAMLVEQRFCTGDEDSSSSYWDYLPHDLEDWREAAKQDVAEEFGKCRSKVYDAEAYAEFGRSFLRWYGGWTHLRNSEVKAANALKGWEKRRRARTDKRGARPKWEALRESIVGESPPGT